MPAETQTPVQAFAHCVQSRCPGNAQEAVDAVQVETIYSFQDTGGDGMFAHPERTILRLRFANEEDGKCPSCGGNRDLSDTPRLQLDDSGYDRMALLDIEPDMRAPDAYNSGNGHTVIDDERTTKLEQENHELREQMAELRGIMLGRQSQEPLAHEVIEGHNGADLTSPIDGQSEVHFVADEPPEES